MNTQDSGEGGSRASSVAGLHGGNYYDLTGDDDRVDRSWSGAGNSIMDDLNNYGEVLSTPTVAANNGLYHPKPRTNFGGVLDDGTSCHGACTPRKVSELIDLSTDDSDDSEPGVAAGRKRPPQRKPSPVGGPRNNCSSPLMRKRRLSTNEHRPHATIRSSCHLHLPARNSGDGARISFGLLSLIDLLKDGNALTCEGSAASSRRKLFESTPSPATSTATSIPFNHQPLHYLQGDNWSCGFRNLQMLISGMMPTLTPIFPRVPTVREIQRTMETLWSRGWDKRNADHHQSSLAGKTTWIGTVEVWSYLSFMRVDAIIVQFIKTPESRAMLGKFAWAYFGRACGQFGCACGGRGSGGNRLAAPLMCSAEYADQLLRKVSDPGANAKAGEGASVPRCDCSLPPLYLQWEGHSVTVVGVRKMGNGTYNLLIFCPQKHKLSSEAKDAMATELARRESTNGARTAESRRCDKLVSSLIELSTNKLQRKDCQVLLSTARIISDEESARRKSCGKDVGFLDAAPRK
ncbi:hypothetical protein ACHAXT_005142 [Thalassiosira profunda]